MSCEALFLEPHGEVGVITLNRAEALTALNNALRRELFAGGGELRAGEQLRFESHRLHISGRATADAAQSRAALRERRPGQFVGS